VIAFNTSIPIAAVSLAIFGWSLFLTFPAILTLVGSVAKPKNRTAAFSLNAIIQIFGNALFTFIAGFMSDAWGINTPFLLLAGIALVVAVYAIAFRKRFASVGAAPAQAGGLVEIEP
jgi:predicted MFS family arabinose efflux permease